jgi:hypothetical protein
MAIIISTDNYGTKIPSDLYLDCSDYNKILRDISDGIIPTGTMNPFPLYSKFDENRCDVNEIPWYTNGTLNLGGRL